MVADLMAIAKRLVTRWQCQLADAGWLQPSGDTVEAVLMPGDPGPLVRRRQLGAALRHYREEAGLSAKDAAEKILSAPSKISRIETAQRSAALRDGRDHGGIYGGRDAEGCREVMA